MAEGIVTKICPRCKIKKPITDFHKRTARPIGVQSRCKDCQRETNILRRTPQEKIKANLRRVNWVKTKKGQESLRKTRQKHRAAVNKRKRDWEKTRAGKSSRMNRQFGLRIHDFEKLASIQNHRCAICGKLEIWRALCIDHDHKTGAIRALLCSKCNVGLGAFDDSVELLQKALNYLYLHRVWPSDRTVPGAKALDKHN